MVRYGRMLAGLMVSCAGFAAGALPAAAANAPGAVAAPDKAPAETPAASEKPATEQAPSPAPPEVADKPAGDAAKAAPATSTPAASSPATSAPSTAEGGAANAATVASGPDAVIEGVRTWLGDKDATVKANRDDLEAAQQFYSDRSGPPLWVDKAGLTGRGKLLVDEIAKADDWGLKASDFALPSLAADAVSTEGLVEAEGKLTLAALKYARFAKGGRVDPSSLSRILDQTPPVKDAKEVMGALAATDAPDAYLRGLHPKHEQFERLRQAMLKLRGPEEPEAAIDPALKIKLPSDGKTLKVGADDGDVALLRKRLKVPAEDGGKETAFDEPLAQALKAFQSDKGLKATGQLTKATRAALNSEGEPKKRNRSDDVERIVLNMERWRWMPEDLGAIYVWNNIPEFYTRVMKDGKVIFKEKIIVGMPEWATPVFSAEMQYVSFNPSWGMPDGIKARELAPRLRQSSGGFFFFGNAGGDVIRAYGLNVYRGGQLIDPDSVDWSKADLRAYSFVQPAGGKNPLGIVKFRFPNKYDVYMHDTTQRELFAQSRRAMSHGCIRVQNPKQFAAIVISEGNGLGEQETERAIASGGEITLKTHIPVHMTYFTAMVNENGDVDTFEDLYGHDNKLAQALIGRAIRSERPVVATMDDDDGAGAAGASPAAGQKKRKPQAAQKPVDNLADAITGIFSP